MYIKICVYILYMAKTSYPKNKQNIYQWRELNIERVRVINKLCMRRKYAWATISKIFLNILLLDKIL